MRALTEKYGIRYISIHAPRGGSDDEWLKRRLKGIGISIHAPRGGSDPVML